ncbi:SurA N-terminal domain-containing protein [Mangrovimonas sp. TPBH4]|uniref:SurA N-terminal domain-containing protein n=1 Tax=Mangrovimonas sp. TPBH4 TaxID=1645914 RepID=UPI0006B40CA6|nr:SurA N-terminal domain-containing protein [Mangrovimonas sp. TPBH4]
MAVLSKIRQRSLFLILIIALALFSFVLSDLFRNSGALNGSQDVVATVNGTDINREEFMQKVENAQRMQGPGASSTQTMNRVYEQEVRKAVLQAQFEELGLSVEKEQMRDLLKQNFSSYPEFSNEAGMFDENKLNEFIANLKAIQNNTPNRAPLGNFQINYYEWVNNEASIAERAKEQVYFNMIKAGVASTLAEAETDYMLENETVDLKYVSVPYTSIADSLVEVTKSDISKYISENKGKYEVEESRDIAFVQFEEVASVQDEEAIQANLVKLLDDREEFNKVTKANETVYGFRSTKNIEDFVNANSDIKYNDSFVFKSTLPTVAADSIYNLPVGEFYGPYKDNGFFKLSKVVAETQMPDSVKVRHILVPYIGATRVDPSVTDTEEEAEATADSILNLIKTKQSKFVDLLELSSDKVSNEKEGVIEFGYNQSFAPEFKAFSFENNVGDIDVVKTSFGYHIIEILDQKNRSRAVKVATIAQKIEPSEETIDEVFNSASRFEVAIQKGDFQEVAKENNYAVKPVSVKVLDENIPGLGSQRAMVRWAYDAETKVGDYKRFSVPGGGYAVVQLVKVTPEGLMSPENASATAIAEIRNAKKAKMIREKISASTVADVAKNQGVATRSASAVNMKNPTLSGAGLEPKVIGVAFGLKEGETSKLIDGNKGVYMVEVTKVTTAAGLDNYQPIANRLTTSRVNAVQSKAYNALKDAAEIEDNRAKFY